MSQLRNILSLLLLSIYLVVLGHSFVPHHHHEESDEKEFCATNVRHENVHGELCADSACHHNEAESAACHFEVKPIPGKATQPNAALLVIALLFEFQESELVQIDRFNPDFSIPDNPARTCKGLRAPPVIA